MGWVQNGVRDFSISRAATQWGIKFPQDPLQTVYVWFDALNGYLSGVLCCAVLYCAVLCCAVLFQLQQYSHDQLHFPVACTHWLMHMNPESDRASRCIPPQIQIHDGYHLDLVAA